MENSYGTNSLDINENPIDTDNDGIPNEDSSDSKFTGDTDDDNDGLSDSIEALLGSSSVNEKDVNRIYINGQLFYLVDASRNDVFDVLYNPTSKATTGVKKQNDNYLIDENGDETWDYVYDILDESVSPYGEESVLSISFLILIVIAIIIPLVIILFSYKRRRPISERIQKRHKKVQKRPLIKKSLIVSDTEKKVTFEMITQTKSLLQNIQQDVEVYMEKLRSIEDQFNEPLVKEEKKVEPLKERPPKIKDINEIEAKVDKLLTDADNKQNT